MSTKAPKSNKGCKAKQAALEIAAVETPIVEVAATPAKRTIQKDRPVGNGVKQPSAGGKCRAVWDFCSEFEAQHGTLPSVKQVKAHAVEAGWNPNNASIEYYQFRKFTGVRGRIAKPATMEASAQA